MRMRVHRQTGTQTHTHAQTTNIHADTQRSCTLPLPSDISSLCANIKCHTIFIFIFYFVYIFACSM